MAWDLFHFKSGTYYDDGEILDKNWFKVSGKFSNWMKIILWSAAATSQTLTYWEYIDAEINVLIWMLGVGVVRTGVVAL